jgi:hypothetical protein
MSMFHHLVQFFRWIGLSEELLNSSTLEFGMLFFKSRTVNYMIKFVLSV